MPEFNIVNKLLITPKITTFFRSGPYLYFPSQDVYFSGA